MVKRSSSPARLSPQRSAAGIELWGGLECTVNRVGDAYLDQLRTTGHDRRPHDLERIADLGIRTLRYPILWERVYASGAGSPDWTWTDERLARLLELGIDPIVGLVHHGSGPRHTHLLDARFAEKLAAFGDEVARRYPWVHRFTPVNEPVTTARFSGLYGHWYPHRQDDRAFAQILFNECRATALTMEAIRATNPDAELVQTEDAGRTFATTRLAYQAEFDNHRRWLSFDLLTGRVDAAHVMWRYLVEHGVKEELLEDLVQHPCAPDVVGLNYYVTSDRYLDHEVLRYRDDLRGGNGRDRYVDIEAVRGRRDDEDCGIAGHAAVLLDAWNRYGIPVALTEVHLGCSRDEQLRWLMEAWQGAHAAHEAGAQVRAVTAWALFGSTDWDSLVTQERGHYEPGAFDARAEIPRRTAVGQALTALAYSGAYDHPALSAPGWWRRSTRRAGAVLSRDASRPTGPPLLITGATGTLGRAFARICRERGIAHQLLGRSEMDIADPGSVAAALARFRPWAVINAAGYVRVDEAEKQQHACFRENTTGAVVLARACQGRGISLVSFSSDLVFDGEKGSGYVEADRPRPLGIYGKSKAEAERQVLLVMPNALMIRTSAFFGPWDEHNFVAAALSSLRAHRIFRASDARVSPTYVPDLCHVALDLLQDGARGIWHLANAGETTFIDLARRIATLASLDTSLLGEEEPAELERGSRRPRYSVLLSARGRLMPTLEDALLRYCAAVGISRSAVDSERTQEGAA